MKAVELQQHGKPGSLVVVERETPKPGPGEVLVSVRACGLNRLDLWMEEGGLPMPVSLPRIPGSEISGVVEEIGAGSEGEWKPGDRVVLQSNLFCGECEFCLAGEESICLHGKLLGVDVDGGFAEQVLVPVRALVKLPDALDFEAGAVLTLAASTAMHMLTSRATVRAGDWVLVMGGASGVGSAAIQIARGLGATVIATATGDDKATLSRELGAHHVVDARDPLWTREVRSITGKRGVDLIVEHVGGKVLEQCFQTLARGGTVVTCGATTGRDISLNIWPIFVKQQRLVGSYGRNRVDLEATLHWAAEGRLRPVVDRVLPLGQTRDAYDALRAGSVQGKVLVRP